MPAKPGPTGKSERTLQARFWAKVAKTPDCWNWTATANSHGYGRFRLSKWQRPTQAHRVSWQLANLTSVPAGMDVLHRCDNPRCVRPDHLFVGTHSDNMRDMIQKGRGKGQHKRLVLGGECWNGHLLTTETAYQNKNGIRCKVCYRASRARVKARNASVSSERGTEPATRP